MEGHLILQPCSPAALEPVTGLGALNAQVACRQLCGDYLRLEGEERPSFRVMKGESTKGRVGPL